LGGLICGGATVAVLFVILLFNNTLKTEEDVARRLGLETLGVVSDANELAQIEEKSKKRKGENNE
jgi:capsular polysaccharide biosynthesis protein